MAALGDSFAAGIGSGRFLTSSADGNDNPCGREDGSYPWLLFQFNPFKTGSPNEFPNFVACSGDKLAQISGQVGKLNGQKFDLITLSISGNDFSFTPIVKACVYPWKIVSSAATLQQLCNTQLSNAQTAINNNAIWGNFLDAVRIIQAQALNPGGIIYITGYAQFFATPNPGDACDNTFFFPITQFQALKMTSTTRLRMNDLVKQVNTNIQNKIVNVLGPSVQYIDIDTPAEGHRFCEPTNDDDPIGSNNNEVWFNDIKTNLAETGTYNPASFNNESAEWAEWVSDAEQQANQAGLAALPNSAPGATTQSRPITDALQIASTFHPKIDLHRRTAATILFNLMIRSGSIANEVILGPNKFCQSFGPGEGAGSCINIPANCGVKAPIDNTAATIVCADGSTSEDGVNFQKINLSFDHIAILSAISNGISMDIPEGEIDAPYEERIAHVVWAAHILSYLAGERNQTGLIDFTEEGFDGEESDAETDKGIDLTGSDGSIRRKFLDCVAELLSPSKGYDYVVTTGLRESEDYVEIDVARNGDFGEPGSRNSVAKSTYRRYFDHFEEYLASASEHVGNYHQSGMSPSWFELIAIEFNRNRTDYWVEAMRTYVATKGTYQDQGQDQAKEHSPKLQPAEKLLDNLTSLLNHSSTGETIFRGPIVYAAYECVTSPDVYRVVQTIFGSGAGSKLWRALKFLSRSVFNCRFLMRVATLLPNFRKVKIFLVSPEQKTILSPKYLVDITDAWSQLSSTMNPSSAKLIATFGDQFKQECARPLTSHSEIKLFTHYEDSSSLTPTIDYFGCSKKTCLLCEGFLQALSHPISTRGRHGLGYPAWGVPFSKSIEVGAALQRLERNLVSRIEMHFTGLSGPGINQVPQSTVISDFSGLSLEAMSIRNEMKKSAEEASKSLQTERRIMDGQAAKSMPASSSSIAPNDSCVMCNKLPAKLCTRCKACHYCSLECQKSDWACHKLLCKEIGAMSPRPSPTHKLAIFFPEKTAKPLLTWVLCHRKASSEYEQYGMVVEYETANTDPFLGTDNPFSKSYFIQRNPRRDRNLGSMMFKREGYSIVLTFRDTFLIDGSTLNRSVLETIRGVKICCYGEVKLHGADPYVPIEVPDLHPIRSTFSVGVGISSISKLLGIPIKLWKFPDIENWINPPGWDDTFGADSNSDAAFLMMESDPSQESWGWAPFPWTIDLGNVLAVRTDDIDLSVEEMRLICYFIRRKVLPMIEDASGSGSIPRTRQEVIDFITRENMESCRSEMENNEPSTMYSFP
ncbi:hypothetical protein G7Y89_g6314 [Cudoniella acicularis]|uniref:MYND-type domain-containing protein n=1 Tax=Cudoniella acicularis TaxID=354080 RepID=A0A8H4RP23_9HELO|nr:hypothetical protein G7Y89_g6314 [Cudoniella acicularis]